MRAAWRCLSLRVGFGAAVIVAALTLAACAAPPVQEMSNARQAVHAARQAGAPQYAPRQYAAAEQWLDDAESALRRGDYGRARTSAGRAERAARAANLAARRLRPAAPASQAPPAASGF